MLRAGMKFVFYTGLIAIACFVLTKVYAREEAPEIKAGKIVRNDFQASDFQTSFSDPLAIDSTGSLELIKDRGGYEEEKVYLSEPQMVDQVFNAIGAKWQGSVSAKTGIKVELKVFDGETWSSWQRLATEDMVGRDDKVGGVVDNSSGEAFSDLVFVENGRGFQYRIILSTTDPKVSPKLKDIEFTYIDSSKGPKAPEFEQGWFKKAFAADTEIEATPTIISRTEWGCPEGETSPRWRPETASKSFQVYHHTVTTNGAEPYSTMRAIWYYQANTREWGDIGYNYLVDQFGHVFKGRNGPEDVIGAHVYGYNTHSIGVAVLGTYTSVVPSSAALSGLSSTLAYSAYLTKSPIKLYGHRELTPTQCPGDAFFAEKADIVSSVKMKLAAYDSLYRYDGKEYYLENNTLYEVPTTDIALSYGFDLQSVADLTAEQFAAMTVSETKLDYFIKDDSRVYIATGGKLKPVSDAYLLSRWGIDKNNVFQSNRLVSHLAKGEKISYLARSFARQLNYYLPGGGYKQVVTYPVLAERGYYSGDPERVPCISSVLLDRYTNRGYLSYLKGVYPKPVVRYQDKLYYHESTYLRLIPNTDILGNWGFGAKDIIDISADEFNSYLLAKDLDYFSRNETQVYIAVGGKLRSIDTDYLESRFGLTFLEATKNRLLVNYRAKMEPVSYLVRSYSQGTVYYMDAAGRKIVVKSVLKNRGYYRGIPERVPYISTLLLNRYNQIGYLPYKDGTLIRGKSSQTIYLVSQGEKCFVSGHVFASWKYPLSRILIVNDSMLAVIPSGDSWPAKKVPTLQGPQGEAIALPAYSGKTAREQHLWLIDSESETHHYANSSTPTDCRNGMAGGYGAYGSAASVSQERYYINMRWLYCTWYEDAGGTTRTRDCDDGLKTWHRHKKVIVTNPANGKSVVVSIEEAGPAIWTGRVSGLSPEAMKAIGAETNDSLTYFWAGLQSMPLGPAN